MNRDLWDGIEDHPPAENTSPIARLDDIYRRAMALAQDPEYADPASALGVAIQALCAMASLKAVNEGRDMDWGDS